MGLMAVLFVTFLYTIRDSFEQRIVEPGDSAPSFAVTTDSGKRVTRSDFGGKLLVLNFWATWCPPCIEEMPSLNDFAQQVSKDGVVVLGVSIDHNEQVYRRFLQQNRLAFETARDPDAGIAAEYGTFKWPETYIINAQGKVVEKHIGPKLWTDPKMLAAVRRHL
jgi:cytochrome c biogenesis protein CcmG, thiol:disulfide interchange protein DsbE